MALLPVLCGLFDPLRSHQAALGQGRVCGAHLGVGCACPVQFQPPWLALPVSVVTGAELGQ